MLIRKPKVAEDQDSNVVDRPFYIYVLASNTWVRKTLDCGPEMDPYSVNLVFNNKILTAQDGSVGCIATLRQS